MGKEIKNGNNSKGNCRENIFSQNAHFFFLWRRVTNPMRHPKTMTKNKKFRFFALVMHKQQGLFAPLITIPIDYHKRVSRFFKFIKSR